MLLAGKIQLMVVIIMYGSLQWKYCDHVHSSPHYRVAAKVIDQTSMMSLPVCLHDSLL